MKMLEEKKARNEERKGKYEYDYIEDAVYFVPYKRTYSSSFQIDNFIFDLDNDKRLVGLEILNVSKIMRIPKIFFKYSLKGKLQLVLQRDKISIKLEMFGLIRNENMKNILNVEKIYENNFQPSSEKFLLQPIAVPSR